MVLQMKGMDIEKAVNLPFRQVGVAESGEGIGGFGTAKSTKW